MPADYTLPPWLVALLARASSPGGCVRGRPSRECNCTWCCARMRERGGPHEARERLLEEWDHDAASLPHEEDRR